MIGPGLIIKFILTHYGTKTKHLTLNYDKF